MQNGLSNLGKDLPKAIEVMFAEIYISYFTIQLMINDMSPEELLKGMTAALEICQDYNMKSAQLKIELMMIGL